MRFVDYVIHVDQLAHGEIGTTVFPAVGTLQELKVIIRDRFIGWPTYEQKLLLGLDVWPDSRLELVMKKPIWQYVHANVAALPILTLQALGARRSELFISHYVHLKGIRLHEIPPLGELSTGSRLEVEIRVTLVRRPQESGAIIYAAHQGQVNRSKIRQFGGGDVNDPAMPPMEEDVILSCVCSNVLFYRRLPEHWRQNRKAIAP
jgi:hypothetical protein